MRRGYNQIAAPLFLFWTGYTMDFKLFSAARTSALWRGLFLCCFLAPLCGCDRGKQVASAGRLPEDLLDTIRLLDLENRAIEIRPQGQRATVFLFTRTDCPISNRYAPTIQRLCDTFSLRGVVFYLVYVDPQQSAADIASHRQTYDYPCAAVRDLDHRFVNQVGARVTPEAIVVDSKGRVVYRGRIDDRFVAFGKSRQHPTREDLALALDATLSGKAVEMPATDAIGCFIADLKQ
jgi:hypothetical protein